MKTIYTEPSKPSIYYLTIVLCLWISFSSATVAPPFRVLEFTKEPQDTVAKAGDQVWLACSAKYEDRAPTVYSWKRNNVLINSWTVERLTRYVMGNGTLFFTSVNPSAGSPDPAHYKCIAEVTEGTKVHRIVSPEVELSLAALPELSTEPVNLNLHSGDTAMFRCHSQIRPEATYSWAHDSKNVLPSSRLILHAGGQVLEIMSLNRSQDAGQYRCIARNSAGQVASPYVILSVDSRAANMRQPALPSFVMTPWSRSVVAGSTVTLFCAVSGMDVSGKLPRVTWLKEGVAILENSGDESSVGRYSIVGTSSLQISNVSLEDGAVYTCRGENEQGMVESEATLTVQVPPSFVTLPRNTYGRVNENIILECEISGSPAPSVLWYKDSDELKESKYFKYVGHSLKIVGLMSTDSGYFQCMGVNSAGKIQAVAQLIVLDEDTRVPDGQIQSFTSSPGISDLDTDIPLDPALPPPPTHPTALNISQTSVRLSWNVTLRPGAAPVTAYTVTTKQLGDPRTQVINVTSAECTVEGLLPATQYVFSITSHNINGHSPRPTNINITTKKFAQVPEAVTNMRVWPTSPYSVQVSWDMPSVAFGAITEFRVYFYSHDQSRESSLTVPSNERTATISDLHPYTEYYIRVVASNGNGAGTPTDQKSVTTFSDKPSGAPTNVTAEAVGTSEIAIRWSPPLPQHCNGEITAYKIRRKKNDGTSRATAYTTGADVRDYDITGLSAGDVYLVRIAAVNVNGTGEFTSWIEVTTFTVELDESRAPGKPSFIQLKAFAREMIVSWGAPDDASDVLVRGYRLGYGVGFPEQHWIENIPHSRRIYSLKGLEPRKNYVVQVMAYNNVGNGPNAQQQEFTLEELDPPADSELLPPLEVKVEILSPTSVMVTWYDNTLGPNQRPLYDNIYTVKYNALSGLAQRKTQYLNSSELFVRVGGLRPYTKYEFSVMTIRGNRFSIYSLAARNTTFEDKPGSPPRDLTITKIEAQPDYLMISWQPPSTPNGRIIHYTIYSNTNYQLPLDKWAVEIVEGYQLNYRFGPVTPSTIFYFMIAAHNSRGVSQPSDAKAIMTADASKEMTDSVGVTVKPPSKNNGRADGWIDTLAEGPKQHSGTESTTEPPLTLASSQTLWIVIACVCSVTVLAVAALVAVMCRKKVLKGRSRPANLKASNQAPKGMSKGLKQQRPDLWIDHDQVELKSMEKGGEEAGMVDESTAMLQDHAQFDVASASVVGDSYMDEPRYSTLGRQRPIIIAPHQHRDAMPRAAVQPMAAENGRPLYPKTQFSTHNYSSTPRVHLGDTCRSATESYNHASIPFNRPYMINGEEVPPPRPPPMEARPYPLRSFNNVNETGHIPKHIVKPQPISVFKPTMPTPDDSEDTGSLKRPPRPPYLSRELSRGSLSRQELKISLKSGSTEHLSSEMDHLNHIMQDLNSINNDIGYAT